MKHNHLKKLESESIHIIREVAAEFSNPVMLYSIGKDSSVMLHLTMKAFSPNKIPFKLLHVDTTWKFKEMIKFRDEVSKKYNLDFIPYDHKDIDRWREPRTGGIAYVDEGVNLQLQGGIDDIWFDLKTKELVVVDYKSQSKSTPDETQAYLDDQWHQGYKRQMDIYVHILRNMKFKVSDMTYFMVCNGEKSFDKFDNKINFTTTLVPYKSDTKWIPAKIKEMKKTLDSEEIPEYSEHCEKCIYLASSSSF